MTISDNLQSIECNIANAQKASALSSNDVTLICVSKYHSVDEAMAVYDAGVRNFAENRPEGLFEKMPAMPDDIEWHLIGTLQTRKVKDVINQVAYFHALDRLKLAKEINKRADHVIKCFVQVNVSGEEAKHGIAPEELNAFVDAIEAYDKIEIVGLMTMAPIDADETALHTYFGQLRTLRDQVQAMAKPYAPCQHLSMGMSGDYAIAIEEGADFVRIGSAFFKTDAE
jgi:pyridoxal phosphate enzyme (YggS family)